MAAELVNARQNLPVDPAKVGEIVQKPGSKELKQKVLAVLKKEAIFDLSVKPHLNHHDRLERGLKVITRLLEIKRDLGWGKEEWDEALRLQQESLPNGLHERAFIPVIESQASDEQQKKWLPRARNYEVIGCYAQTEMGHGSNVQQLETTATFDVKTDEFIINSPTLTSAKWWIGGLGVFANHSVLQAILYLPDAKSPTGFKNYGPHIFIVPIRDLKTHKPLPGVTVGDIGPKAYRGFGSIDNGYLRVDNVRIPRDNLLQRFCKVEKNGVYTPPVHDKLSYGSMVYLRAGIPEVAGWELARAVTTATRYCTVRRQFSGTGGSSEDQVIKYASVKFRLTPMLARAYAFILAGRQFWKLYETMADALVNRHDASLLPEVHNLSTALKVVSTWDGTSGAEEVRKAMGGHGFSVMGGVSEIVAHSTPAQTYEGDNFVISQQISRALLKALAKIAKNPAEVSKLSSSTTYLQLLLNQKAFNSARAAAASPADWINQTVQIAALEHRAAGLVGSLAAKMQKNPGKPITDLSWDTAGVARAHAEVYFAREFWNSINALPASKEKDALATLAHIFALDLLVRNAADLFQYGHVDARQNVALKAAYDGLVEGFSTEMAIAMTDAFGFDDYEMGILGREDGAFYQGMWDEVRKNNEKLLPLKEEVLRITGVWKEKARL